MVRDREVEFQVFLDSVQFKKDAPPEWKVPADWALQGKVEAGQEKVAAFVIGPKADGLELTVNKFGPAAVCDLLFANVNRWRKQLALLRIDEDDVLQFVKETKSAQGEHYYLVDLTGPGSGKTMMPDGKAPPGPKPPVDVFGPGITFPLTPEGWQESQEEAPRGPHGVQLRRTATYEVVEGNARAVVTVLPISRITPKGLEAALLANVNRWAVEQLHLPAVTAEKLPGLVRQMDVGGYAGYYVRLVGPEGQSILGVLVPRPDKTWSFTMKGPSPLVERQQHNFEAFVKSVKFEGGRK